jgi:hypothetical protein
MLSSALAVWGEVVERIPGASFVTLRLEPGTLDAVTARAFMDCFGGGLPLATGREPD